MVDKIKQIARQLLYQKDSKVETWRELSELYQEVNRVDSKPLLQGEKGEKGDNGKDGINGIDGENGLDGKDGIDGIDGQNGRDGIDGENGTNGLPGLNGSPDSAEDIISKINTLEKAIDFKVLFNVPTIDETIKQLKGKLDISDIKNGLWNQPAKGKLDQRWHGGGLALVSHDSTLTGLGTPASPLSAVPVTAGVSSLNGMVGPVILAAGSGITLSPFGNTITISSNATGGVWGSITGTLSNQTDLQTALNAKQNTLTIGNLTETTSSVLQISGGTGAIIGSGLTIQVNQASGSVSGYLSSTDWNTFNNKGSGTVTSVSGTSNRITSTGGATPVIDISASYVGQSSITTLGTITTGVWNGTAIANANLANSSLTIGSTNVALGATVTTFAGLVSVTSTTFIGALTGNASTATALATGRTISISGDLTYTSPSFDGSGNVTAAGTLATVNSNVGTFAIATITVNGKGLVTGASAASTTGSGAVVLAGTPTLTTAILGSSTATTQAPADNSTKVATTAYVDAAVLGQNFKEAARVATTANLVGVYLNGVFTYTATGTDNIDGINLVLNDRVLVKNQADNTQNGIYKVTTAGSLGVAGVLTRATDANQSNEFKTGDSLFVTSGTTLASTTWAYTGIDSPTIGTDAITYAQTAGQGTVTAGNGISVTGLSVAIDTSVTVDKNTAQALTNKDLTGAGNTFPTFNQNTSGSAATLTTTRTLWGQNFNGSANVSGSLTAVGNITGGASSMTITAGTGNSRTLALQSTTSGGTATTFLTGNADQSVTFAGALTGVTSVSTSAASPLLLTNGQLVTIALTSQTVGGTTLTIPNFANVSDTFAFITLAQAFTNKTLTSSTNVLGGVTLTLGSDANYDTYYRNSSGVLTRLANGTTGQVLVATTSNAPSWAGAPAGTLTGTTLNSAVVTASIATLANLTSNGYVKTSGGVGTLGIQGVPIPIADGGTNSIAALGNQCVMTSVGGAIVESGAITDGEGIQRNNTTFVDAPIAVTPQGRLTLTSGTPITVADVTAATTIYFALYKGDTVSLYDATRWKIQRFTEQSILTTAAQTGTTHNGTKVIDGLTDTSQLVRGMLVTGTNVGAAAVISTIDSATQVTVSVNSTGSASNTITFKLPASTAYDVFYVQGNGKLQFSNAWTTTAGASAARADALTTQNGVSLNNAIINTGDSNAIPAKTGLYLGSICTTTTNGQTEDSLLNRLIWNTFNKVNRQLLVRDSTSSWTWNSSTYHSTDASTANRVNVMVGIQESFLDLIILGMGGPPDLEVGVAEDATNTNNADLIALSQVSTVAAVLPSFGVLKKYPAIGFHFYQLVEAVQGGTATIYGTNGVVRKSGADGSIMA